MGDRISPPETGYAPEPSRSSPDRDPDGRIARRPMPRKKGKKDNKEEAKKKAPPQTEDKTEDKAEDGKVDILAVQIAIYPARSSASPAPGPT